MDLITLGFAILFTVMTAVIVPVYWVKHGPTNFLWFSDIALFGMTIALWLESPLIASMMALAVLIPETVWVVSFIGGLLFGRSVSSLAGYMFDQNIPRYLRGLSLFHLALPPAMLWMIYRYGYDARALPAQVALAWLVVPASYLLAPAAKNVNWVRGFGHPAKTPLRPSAHMLLMMLVYPLVIYLPTHWLLKAFARSAGAAAH